MTTAPLQWRPTNAPVASSRTDDIWFVDPETGWAVNSNGHILMPTLPAHRPDRFTMNDLLLFVDDVNPIGD